MYWTNALLDIEKNDSNAYVLLVSAVMQQTHRRRIHMIDMIFIGSSIWTEEANHLQFNVRWEKGKSAYRRLADN